MPYFLVQKCLKWPKIVLFVSSLASLAWTYKNEINLICVATMQKFIKYVYFICNSFLEHLFWYFLSIVM